MIDPVIALAFAVRNRTHALLLGSGVSRSAGILSGWEVLLDLIRKVAVLNSEDPEPDPAAWYERQFGAPPNYSALLAQLGRTQAERAAILHSYFEPSDDDREQGLKLPTAGHHAVARLVRDGYVRVVMTTNFDRLMEQALEAAGVTASVVASGDQATGAAPLVQDRARVIKVHGDYMDLRTRNTAAELAEYEPGMVQLVDRVLDEFGLLVCGWSGEWDHALRGALERMKNRRYTLFWAYRGELRGPAPQLVQDRGVGIPIRDADGFLTDVADKVQALVDMERPHPATARAATAIVKRYVVDPASRIRLRDFVAGETERVIAAVGPDQFPASLEVNAETVGDRLSRYESRLTVLQACISTGCFHGDVLHHPVWIETIQRLANARHEHSGINVWLDMNRYPATLLAYAAGVASVAAGRYDTLAALLLRPRIRTVPSQAEVPAAVGLGSWVTVDNRIAQMLPGMEGRLFATNERIGAATRDALRDAVPEDADFTLAFDRFEYLAAVTVNDLRETPGVYVSGSPGPYVGRRQADGQRIWTTVPQEAERAGDDWPPLRAGLFSGSLDRFKAAHEFTMYRLRNAPWAWHLDLDLP